MLVIDEKKTALNRAAKVSMDDFLRSKSWVEKVKSIERMNAMERIAKAAMKRFYDEEGMSNPMSDEKPSDMGHPLHR